MTLSNKIQVLKEELRKELDDSIEQMNLFEKNSLSLSNYYKGKRDTIEYIIAALEEE